MRFTIGFVLGLLFTFGSAALLFPLEMPIHQDQAAPLDTNTPVDTPPYVLDRIDQPVAPSVISEQSAWDIDTITKASAPVTAAALPR